MAPEHAKAIIIDDYAPKVREYTSALESIGITIAGVVESYLDAEELIQDPNRLRKLGADVLFLDGWLDTPNQDDGADIALLGLQKRTLKSIYATHPYIEGIPFISISNNEKSRVNALAGLHIPASDLAYGGLEKIVEVLKPFSFSPELPYIPEIQHEPEQRPGLFRRFFN